MINQYFGSLFVLLISDIPRERLCVSCHRLPKGPRQTPCGHRYCSECIENILPANSDGAQCVVEDCDGVIHPGMTYPDKASEREILQLGCYCSHVTHGCTWTGTLTQLMEDHLPACAKAQEHDACARQECLFQLVGCSEKVERGRIEEHCEAYKMKHLNLLENSTKQVSVLLKNIHESTKEAVMNLITKLYRISQVLTNVESQTNEAEVITSARNASESLNDDTYDEVSRLQTQAGAFESAVGTIRSSLQRMLARLEELRRDNQRSREDLEIRERKIKQTERLLAQKDQAIHLNHERIQQNELTSYDGVMVWKLTDFQDKQRSAIERRVTNFYSPHFYTSRRGYKMKLRVYPNGDGIGVGTHVSLYFVLCKGPNDAVLQWPFRLKVTLMILSQGSNNHAVDSFSPDPASSSWRKPVTEQNVASGVPLFLPQSQLQDDRYQYVKEDTMYIKAVVDINGL